MSSFVMKLEARDKINDSLLEKWEKEMQKVLGEICKKGPVLSITRQDSQIEVTLRDWNSSRERAIVFLARVVAWMHKEKKQLLVIDSQEIVEPTGDKIAEVL